MKQVFDTLLVIITLPISVPLSLLVMTIIKLVDRGPCIHWSSRIGKNNIPYKMPKFRTMKLNTPQLPTHLIDGKSYLIPYGNFLRKTSLDEIPQLWSVLSGDMSIVGPRPALFNQSDLQALRTKYNVHILRPGITGWAQVNGRDELSIEEKVKFDCEYLQRQSFFFDLKIILITILKVITKKNIAH